MYQTKYSEAFYSLIAGQLIALIAMFLFGFSSQLQMPMAAFQWAAQYQLETLLLFLSGLLLNALPAIAISAAPLTYYLVRNSQLYWVHICGLVFSSYLIQVYALFPLFVEGVSLPEQLQWWHLSSEVALLLAIGSGAWLANKRKLADRAAFEQHK